MAIHADLRDFPLAEMLFFLGNRRSSGRLVVTSGELSVTFTLHAGSITAVESSDPRHRLGRYLLENETVGQSALTQLLDQQRRQPEHRVIGELIVERGLADPSTIARVLDAQMIATLTEALLRDGGSVRFERADTQLRGVEPAGTTAQQVFEGLRRADEYRRPQSEDAPLSDLDPEPNTNLEPFVADDVNWDCPGVDDTRLEPVEPSHPCPSTLESPTVIGRLSNRFQELVGLTR